MQALFKASLLAAAVSLLVACDQPQPQTAADLVATAKQTTVSPEQAIVHSGELLSVNVKDMDRRQFVQELQKAIGSRIELRTGGEGKVSIKVDHASLRAVLAQVFNDAPYSINMQFNNVQDNFPALVLVSPHGAPAPIVRSPRSMPEELRKATENLPKDILADEDDDLDFEDLPTPEAKLEYFLQQDVDTQSSIVFDLDADDDSDLLNTMFNHEQTGRGIKVEILDNLSFGEYDSAVRTIQDGLQSNEPSVQAKSLEVLGELGSEDDIETVQKYTGSDYPASVREAAKEALEFLEP